MSGRRAAALLITGALFYAPGSSLQARGGELEPDPEVSGPLSELWLATRRHFEAVIEERRRKPPVAVEVDWAPRSLGALDLGAPLVGLSSADIDDDGADELVVLTTRELLVLEVGKQLSPATRVPLPVEPAELRPRDPVGTLWVGGRSRSLIVARTSEQKHGIQVRFADGSLTIEGNVSGYPACGDVSFELDRGRNYFLAESQNESFPVPLPAAFWSLSCGRGLVDPAGNPLRVFAVVGLDASLYLTCQDCDWDSGIRFEDVGYAHAVVDVNRDGRPDLTTSKNSAPGDRDRVEVFLGGTESPQRAFSHEFKRGIAGITSGDLDSDHADEIVVASRTFGSTTVEFWTLNR